MSEDHEGQQSENSFGAALAATFFPVLADSGVQARLNQLFAEVGEVARSLTTRMQAAMAPMQETLRIISEDSAKSALLESAGWLPHSTTPYGQFGPQTPREEIDRLMASHYSQHWEDVEAGFIESMQRNSLDEEAQATFREALTAHRLGLFRVTPRLLFPEIERVVRNDLYDGQHTQIVSQHRLQEATGELGLSEFSTPGIYGLRLFKN